MSLYRQLWIAVAVLLLLVFATATTINGVSSSRYLTDQLSLKNQDDAIALALSLSQQQLDSIALEIQLATQLDQGSYARVQFRDIDGNTVFDRRAPQGTTRAPGWVQTLFSIRSEPGSAEVSNGWNQLGTVELKSRKDFAYDELWAGIRRSFVALILAILIAGSTGSLLLRRLLEPLDQVVAQAEAIGERRFPTLPEPFTREFATLTRSMNTLAERVRGLLLRESEKLTRERAASDQDALTGLMLRQPFLDRLHARLTSEETEADGALAILRLKQLTDLNQLYGREAIDNLLRSIGDTLSSWSRSESGLLVGRLNASDFCVLGAQQTDAKRLGEQLQQRVISVLQRHVLLNDTKRPTACCLYGAGDSMGELLSRLDQSLLLADDRGNSALLVAAVSNAQAGNSVREQATHWQQAISSALADQRLLLQTYPVVDAAGGLIHREGMLRIRVNDEIINAGSFMPWVSRLNLSAEVDRAVVCLALDLINDDDLPSCVNLTVSSLTDADFAQWLSSLLDQYPQASQKLSLDIAESLAYAHPREYQNLRRSLRGSGCSIGLEHMGNSVADIGLLGELGADYLKIDALFVRGIDSNSGSQSLLRTYARIAESMGLPCIAEGVSNTLEQEMAISCGATGVSGPGVQEAQVAP